jgi:hypothetical protein
VKEFPCEIVQLGREEGASGEKKDRSRSFEHRNLRRDGMPKNFKNGEPGQCTGVENENETQN